MASFEPAFLPIGTDVSAKYRGAFCEAKVKKVVKSVKCKVLLKEAQTSVMVTDDNITGVLKVGSTVELKHPDTGQQVEGIINKITDSSTYTVVFDDADERTLRRTQLCLKGEKHFMESETLDNLPLSNPEHFGTPVLQNKKSRRSKAGEESESEEAESSSEEESPRRAAYKGRYQELVGKVMCMESSDKRKGAQCPVLVVLPDAHPLELKNRDHLLVRSFRDAKFMVANRKDLKEFLREIAIKNEDKNMKAAFEKALLYFDSHELPLNWNREELLGSDNDDGDEGEDTSDDDEPNEEKDRFVAQLYKFMDDRGTPINKGPCIGNKDLNLYRLFRAVQTIGGYNKVTNQMKWRLVYSKMGLPPSNTASHQIKNAYKKYLHAFEDFYRKLGSTMGTISRPGRCRQNSGRSILSFRGRDKEPSPRSPRTEKTLNKDDKSKEEDKSKVKIEDSASSGNTEAVVEATHVEELDSDVVRRTPRREKASKEDTKSDREKKEEAKSKKEREEKKDEEKKEDNRREETREEKKKEEKREERKSLRQSIKEEEKKDAVKIKEEDKKDAKKEEEKKDTKKEEDKKDAKKEEDKKDAKKEEDKRDAKREEDKKDAKKEEEKRDAKRDDGRTDRVLRREREEREDEGKKDEEEPPKEILKKRITRRKSGRNEEDKKDNDEKKDEDKATEEKTCKEKKEKELKIEPKKDETKKPCSAKKEKKSDVKKKAEEQEIEAKAENKSENKEESKTENKLDHKPDRPKSENKLEHVPEIKAEISVENKAEIKFDSKIEVKAESKADSKMEAKAENRIESCDKVTSEEIASEDESTAESQDHDDDEDYPTGTKLRVKYGRGRNQKIYEAKVVESGKEGPHKNYLVHYAGWNTRYDEWVRPDRIVCVVDKPEMTRLKKKHLSPRSPKTPPSVNAKPDSPVAKKRGRQLSTHQTPSPGGCSVKSSSSSAADSKIQKNKPIAAAKTRATRSNSTEIRAPDGLPAPTKHRITRRSSGLTDSIDTSSPGDLYNASESETESELAPPSASGDLTSERDDDDETKETELDTSMEEEEPLEMKEHEPESEMAALEDNSSIGKDTEDSAKEDSVDTKLADVMHNDSATEMLFKSSSSAEIITLDLSVPEEAVIEKLEIIKSDSARPEDLDLKVFQDEKPVDNQPLTEEASYQELSRQKEVVHVREMGISGTLPIETKTEPEHLLLEEKAEDKFSDLEEPSLPQLKKIEIDIIPSIDKKDSKEKVKAKKKEVKEPKKGRQAELRASLLDIPTLEPMMIPADFKPAGTEITPSPYDFVEADLDSPWQPEITKKWEPTVKTPTASRDVKTELKKSLETEKKKVKKKPKKNVDTVDGEGEKTLTEEQPTKLDVEVKDDSSLEVQQEKPLKKKGRKKKEKELNGDIKRDISTYEDTVNSVIESCKILEDVPVLLTTVPEKEDKSMKKRKTKISEPPEETEVEKKDSIDMGKKESAKTTKVVKGTKAGKKNLKKSKGENSAERIVIESNSSAAISVLPLTSPDVTGVAVSRREKRARSQSPDTPTVKQARWDAGSPTISSVAACAATTAAASKSNAILASSPKPQSGVASPKPGPSITVAACPGPVGLLSLPTEALVISVSPNHGFEPRLDPTGAPKPVGVVANTVLDNTPPTTPENDLDEARSATSDSQDNMREEIESSDSGERTFKGGSESPSVCDFSTSSVSSEVPLSVKCVAQSSKTLEVESVPKRKRNDDSMPVKKKRFNSSRTCKSDRNRKSPKYGEDDASRSSVDQNSTQDTVSSGPISPLKHEILIARPPKFHFCDDLGTNLEGEQRINFLMTKMSEIRKEYARIKSEIAAIDRRRKRARRKEKESSQVSQGEMEST